MTTTKHLDPDAAVPAQPRLPANNRTASSGAASNRNGSKRDALNFDTPRSAIARALMLALGATVIATSAMSLVGSAVAGPRAMWSALAAGAAVVVVFGPGLPVMRRASQLSASLALMIALLTYSLQMVLVLLVLSQLQASDWAAGRLDGTWIGLTSIAIAVGCALAFVVGAMRARIPAFDGGAE